MLIKLGVNFKILKLASSIELLKKEGKIAKAEEEQEEFLYAEMIALHADLENGNADLFPFEEIKDPKVYGSFVGTPININHDRKKVVGKIIEAFLVEKPKEKYVIVIGKISRIEFPDICKDLESGKICSVSMEASVSEAHCPIPGCN